MVPFNSSIYFLFLYLFAIQGVFAQSEEQVCPIQFRGTIYYEDSIQQTTRIQIIHPDTSVLVIADSLSRYSIKADLDLNKAFYLVVSAKGFVEKRIHFNLISIPAEEYIQPPTPYRPIESIDIQMISLHQGDSLKVFDVGRFYYDSQIKLDLPYYVLCKIVEENYILNAQTNRKTYYTNGKVHMDIPISNGQVNGTIIEYDEEDVVIMRMTVANDKLHGKYWSRGRIEELNVEQFYTNGELIEHIHQTSPDK
jgi:hypothetical protein